jgi:hypothetical protein
MRKENMIKLKAIPKVYTMDQNLENSDFIKALTDFYINMSESKLAIELIKTDYGFKYLTIRYPKKENRLKLNLA